MSGVSKSRVVWVGGREGGLVATSRGYTCLLRHFLLHLLIAGCDIGVQISIRPSELTRGTMWAEL